MIKFSQEEQEYTCHAFDKPKYIISIIGGNHVEAWYYYMVQISSCLSFVDVS